MRCPGNYCSRGFSTCCKECDAYHTQLCKEACPGAEIYKAPAEECLWAKAQEEEENKAVKRWERILLLVAIVALAFAIWQSVSLITYIDSIGNIEKEQPVAADYSNDQEHRYSLTEGKGEIK